MKTIFIILFIPTTLFSQKSITKSDIEVCTQLTLLKVKPNHRVEFEKQISVLSNIAKTSKISETFDWLTYTTDTKDYLFVNFSNEVSDILTLQKYRNEFKEHNLEEQSELAFQSLNKLGISVKFNYIKEMLLPWSTVKQISVAEFPLAQMFEYEINVNDIDKFDEEIRKLIQLLKDTKYPYPLEGSRGSIGAYEKVILVWFYDKRTEYEGAKDISNWMKEKNALKKFQSIRESIDKITSSSKVYNLKYKEHLSY